MKKEKVVAVRLTQSQWETLEWARRDWFSDAVEGKTMSAFIGFLLRDDIDIASRNRATALKKAEAAAKRKATKEAKKAASES